MQDQNETECKALSAETMEMKPPTLSVIVISYQSGDKLYQALESILAQCYEDFELIVCDDGSEHFDQDRVRKLTKGRRTKILCQKTNKGTVRNINDGLLLCAGEWVMLLAADDMLAADDVLLEVSRRAAETQKEWMIGPAMLCNKKVQPTEQLIPTKTQIALLQKGTVEDIWSILCQECFIPSGGTIYRRELLLKFGGFDTHYHLVEDWPLFLKLIRMGYLPEVFTWPVTMHRADGISQKAAGKNQKYQQDLIETMHKEILPYLDILAGDERRKIETLCQDKEEIYKLRFESTGLRSKTTWLLTHTDTILRKITRRGVT